MINIEDFLTIKKVNSDANMDMRIVKTFCLDWENVVCNTNTFPETSLKIKEIEIKLIKRYDEKNILKEFIDKILEISEPETYNERVYEHTTVRGIETDKEVRQLMSRMISCGSYIAVNGRIGPAHFVLVPHYYYKKLQNFIIDGKLTSMNIFPTNLLTNKIIFGRKNKDIQAGIFLFLDEERNRYSLKDIGTAKNQYHILKVRCLQDERRKKIKQINESENS